MECLHCCGLRPKARSSRELANRVTKQDQKASKGIGILSEVGWSSGAVQTRISWTDLPRGIIHKIYARRVHDSRRWNIFVSGSNSPPGPWLFFIFLLYRFDLFSPFTRGYLLTVGQDRSRHADKVVSMYHLLASQSGPIASCAFQRSTKAVISAWDTKMMDSTRNHGR